ncbi:MAG: cyclic nucleotide-binding domain-containing protein [Chloroflexota bacterium]|nr:cyclic nucleotide-binding domain-containing protein [Chloroflexota bacterium]
MEKRGLSLTEIQEIPKESLTLLVGSPGVGKSAFCHQIVLNSIAADRPIIFVTTEQCPSGITAILRDKGMGEAAALNFIDAFSQTVGLAIQDQPDTISANCEDLNSISMAIAKLQQKIGKRDILLSFDSLTSPYLFNKEEVFRFMRLCLVKFAAEGNSVVALMDEGCGKSEDLVAMMSIADGVMKIEIVEDRQLLNVVKHPRVRPTRIEVPIEPKGIELKSTRHFDPTVMRQFVKCTFGQEEARVEALGGTLRGIPLFSSISADDLSNLSRRLTRRRYRKGEIIFHKDDLGSTFHIINIGSVKLSIPSEKKEDVFLAYLGSGDFFGELALLDEHPRSATATAIEPTETLALERGDFLDFLKCYPDVAVCMLSVLAQRIRNLNSQLENIIIFEPKARLAETLMKLVDIHGSETWEGWEITVPLTLAGLAGMVGASAATIGLLLRDFQAAGIVTVKKQHYIIHKPEELRKRAPSRGD